MDRACMEYGIKGGLIFCLAREFDAETNQIVLEKAIRYRNRGVVGIDLAGTEKNAMELGRDVAPYAAIFRRARESGLGTTIHTGETRATSGEGVISAVRNLQPNRIGHGIRAAYSEEALEVLAESGTVLEVCPTSNLHTRAVSGVEDFRMIIGNFLSHEVRFTINTDGTYLCGTNLKNEFEVLMNAGAIDSVQAEEVRKEAFRASFLD